MGKTIKAVDWEYAGSNDAGTLIKAVCPECNRPVTLCVDGSEWWDTTCSCGYTWQAYITIEGEK